jgi:hypothetical protein
LDTADLEAYQRKLSNDSTIGYSVLGPDNKTVYSLEGSSGIYLTPRYTMTNNVPSNYRTHIKVDDVYTAAAQHYTNNQIAAIPKAFWCTGKVNGFTSGDFLENLGSSGRYEFTCTRVSGQASGAYYIRFNTPQTSAHYTIQLTNQATGLIKVWDATIPTVNGFYIISYNTSNALTNSVFHFSVIA